MITLTSGERKCAIVGLANFLLTMAEMEKVYPTFSYTGPRPSKLKDYVKHASSIEDWLTVWRGACSNVTDHGSYTNRTKLVCGYNVRSLTKTGIPDVVVNATRFLDSVRRVADNHYNSPIVTELSGLTGTMGAASAITFPKVIIDGTPPDSVVNFFFSTMYPVWAGTVRVRLYCERCGMPITVSGQTRCGRCNNA